MSEIFHNFAGQSATKFMKEIWKEITGYEGYFEVSNLGNFRSKDRIIKYKQKGTRLYPGKPVKTETIVEGYQRIVLMKEGVKKRYMCHRLVAQMFIPNPDNKPFVNHINGNPKDNRVDNLEWCTQSENELHSYQVLGNSMKGKTAPKYVYRVGTFEVNGQTYTECIGFKSISNALKLTGAGCIEGIKKAIKANRLYHGYHWYFQMPDIKTLRDYSEGKYIQVDGNGENP